MSDTTYDPESIKRLKKDMRQAAATLSDDEARFLVDSYYIMQEGRKRSNNQVRALSESGEPHTILQWLASQSDTMEGEIKKLLDVYTDGQPVGKWMKSIHGIGPVIAAGLIAHIDIHRVNSAGQIWRFAGLDPTVKWGKGQKRPWNAALKTLCWKVGQSFMKFHGNENCWYGHRYKERKAFEVERNDSGGNRERAATILTEKNFGRGTEAYKHLSSGKLPPAQIDAMARRHVVKLFLSHFFIVWYFLTFNRLPPSPYAIAIIGHKDFIPPPNADVVPGLSDALRAAYPTTPIQ